MTMATTVHAFLQSLNLDYQLVAHPHTFSSRETAAAAEIPQDHIAKGVVLKDAAGYLLAIIPGNHWIRLHALQQELNRPLELASEQEVDKLFSDTDPGAVPCIGPAYGIETVLDEALCSLACVYFESGDHEHLVRVSGEDFHKLMGGVRHGYFSHAGHAQSW